MMEKLEALRETIVPVLQPFAKRIAVFGSFVRGEETPQSDIDILVNLKPQGKRPPLGLKWFGMEMELSRALGRRVDLVCASTLSPYIRPYVEKEMVVLYGEG